jgi:hypothetical protein
MCDAVPELLLILIGGHSSMYSEHYCYHTAVGCDTTATALCIPILNVLQAQVIGVWLIQQWDCVYWLHASLSAGITASANQ